MKKIVLPTDFSANADKAISYAKALFKNEETTFYIVNIIDGTVPHSTTGIQTKRLAEAINKSLNAQSEEGLAKTMATLGQNDSSPNHTFLPVSLQGNFHEAMQEFVAEKDIDFVVMGTKGASGIKEVVLGSNTASILGKLIAPVLAVPIHIEFSGIKEIVFATDYEMDYSEIGLRPLLELRKLYDSELAVLYLDEHQKGLTDTQKTAKTYLQTLLKEEKSDFFALDGVGVTLGCRIFAQSRRAAMICLIAKEHQKLVKLFTKSQTKGLVNQANLPILVLNQFAF